MNQKYWMHLKHLGEQYAHQVSLDILTFCKEQDVSVIAFPKYDEEYRRHVLKGAGNFGTLHLSTRIREYLTYKVWKEGILVLDVKQKKCTGFVRFVEMRSRSRISSQNDLSARKDIREMRT